MNFSSLYIYLIFLQAVDVKSAVEMLKKRVPAQSMQSKDPQQELHELLDSYTNVSRNDSSPNRSQCSSCKSGNTPIVKL